MFTSDYADVFAGDDHWRALQTPEGDTFEWDEQSTYVRKPPYCEGITPQAQPVRDSSGARVLAQPGDPAPTDPTSPAGATTPDPPAARDLTGQGLAPRA